MATSYVDVLLQLHDQLGSDVLAGGKIYTYAAGTTTPLVTYQDLAGATPNANPVILDSIGMAVIRQTNGVAYKWLVKSSAGVTLWTRDDITVGAAASSSGTDYLVHMTFAGTPSAQAFMGGHIFDDDVTFPIDFEGSQGAVQTNPGSSFVISIRKNDVQVGTATISSGGAYTFATTSHVTVPFSAGDKLTFLAPDSIPGGADFTMTIPGALA